MVQLSLSLLVAALVAIAGRNIFKEHPTIIYAIAVAVDVVAVVGSLAGFEGDAWRFFYQLIRRGTLSMGFIMVVMYIGCFKNGGAVKKWLLPVRAELSIVSMLLMIPHVVLYVMTYNTIIMNGLTNRWALTWGSYGVAIFLTVLFVVLGIMSFRVIRNTMNYKTWKKIQRLAYPFFVLIFLHVFLARLRGLPADPKGVLIGTIPYLVVIAGYVVFRVVRYVLDKREEAQKTVDAPLGSTIGEPGLDE